MSRKRRWTEEELRQATRLSTSYRQTLKKLGLVEAGGNYDQIKKYVAELKIDITHFKGKGWSKGLRGVGKPFWSMEEILVKNSTYQSFKLKNRLFKEGLKERMCEMCGWAKHTVDGYLPLELDHINGDRHDNRLENLRVLCPNCHSLQPTHRGRKLKKLPR